MRLNNSGKNKPFYQTRMNTCALSRKIALRWRVDSPKPKKYYVPLNNLSFYLSSFGITPNRFRGKLSCILCVFPSFLLNPAKTIRKSREKPTQTTVKTRFIDLQTSYGVWKYKNFWTKIKAVTHLRAGARYARTKFINILIFSNEWKTTRAAINACKHSVLLILFMLKVSGIRHTLTHLFEFRVSVYGTVFTNILCIPVMSVHPWRLQLPWLSMLLFVLFQNSFWGLYDVSFVRPLYCKYYHPNSRRCKVGVNFSTRLMKGNQQHVDF